MIDTAPTGFFLFVGLMIAAGVWLFSLPEPTPASTTSTAATPPSDASAAAAEASAAPATQPPEVPPTA